mgnify:CR=1 FL=1
MGTQNELVQRLEDGYNKFSKGQKKLADFIREDYDKAAFMTAASSATGKCSVSITAIWHILKKLLLPFRRMREYSS